MRASFLAQPFPHHGLSGWAANWILQQLEDPEIISIQMAVAWIKRSGLTRLEEKFRSFRTRGGIVSAIIGIDEGGATKQGLQLALDIYDEVVILHDPSSRTFHPKVYLATGTEKAELLVGSNNLTAGGLYNNYEAALGGSLNTNNEEDVQLLREILTWFELLKADSNVSRVLTNDLLLQLVNDPRYRIADEDKLGRERSIVNENRDGVSVDTPEHSVFKTPNFARAPMAPAIRPVAGPRQRPTRTKGAVQQITQSAAQGAANLQDTTAGTLTWQKVLSRSDAQHPPKSTSNPTGNLRLAKAENDINHQTFFRETMFGDQNWQRLPQAPRIEATDVVFSVIIGGISRGQHRLRVTHAVGREAGQHNVPTVLHWGTLTPILHSVDYSGASVIISRTPQGDYLLEIL